MGIFLIFFNFLPLPSFNCLTPCNVLCTEYIVEVTVKTVDSANPKTGNTYPTNSRACLAGCHVSTFQTQPFTALGLRQVLGKY